MQCTDTCTDACLGATTHLQVNCCGRCVSQQQHHEEEWVWSREDVPLVSQDNHASSYTAHTVLTSTTLQLRYTVSAHTQTCASSQVCILTLQLFTPAAVALNSCETQAISTLAYQQHHEHLHHPFPLPHDTQNP